MTDTGRRNSERETGSARSGKGGRPDHPALTDSLRQIYDSVLDEPLPDSLKDLLSKLDEQTG